MKAHFTTSLLVSTLVMASVLTACGHQYRNVSTGQTAANVKSDLQKVLKSGVIPSADFVSNITADPSSKLFYFDGGTDPSTHQTSQLGPVRGVMANSLLEYAQASTAGLSFVKGYFVARPNGKGGFDGALVVGYANTAIINAANPPTASTTTTTTSSTTTTAVTPAPTDPRPASPLPAPSPTSAPASSNAPDVALTPTSFTVITTVPKIAIGAPPSDDYYSSLSTSASTPVIRPASSPLPLPQSAPKPNPVPAATPPLTSTAATPDSEGAPSIPAVALSNPVVLSYVVFITDSTKTAAGTISGRQLIMKMQNGDASVSVSDITVVSRDVSSSTLMSNLKLIILDATGSSLGQISSLQGLN